MNKPTITHDGPYLVWGSMPLTLEGVLGRT
jgi:hypothetical protein